MAERAGTVRRRVAKWLARAQDFSGVRVADDSALLDEVDETLGSDENIEILAARAGLPLPVEMGAKAGEYLAGQEADALRQAYEECERRKPGARRSGIPESCRIVPTHAGTRRYCVVEDRRAGRFVKKSRAEGS